MTQRQCKECRYYLRHYTFDNRRIFRIHCGHCTRERIKRKLPDAAACEYFMEGLPQEEAFPSKEYLSKELLHYLLNLELLPEIKDYEQD